MIQESFEPCYLAGAKPVFRVGLRFVLCTLLSFFACHPAEISPRRPLVRIPGQLKVMTFNVNWAAKDLARACLMIRMINADIVALQETTPRWEAFLRPRLSSTYPNIRFRHHAGGGGMAFLSKMPFEDFGEILPPPGGMFPAWLVGIKTPRGQIFLLNVHLRPQVTGYFSTPRIRRKEMSYFLDHMQGRRPLVVLGDFNEYSRCLAFKELAKRGFTSAIGRFDPKTPTWRWRTWLATLQKRMDDIFYSKGMRCVAAQVVGPAGSDHYPVEAVFSLR